MEWVIDGSSRHTKKDKKERQEERQKDIFLLTYEHSQDLPFNNEKHTVLARTQRLFSVDHKSPQTLKLFYDYMD